MGASVEATRERKGRLLLPFSSTCPPFISNSLLTRLLFAHTGLRLPLVQGIPRLIWQATGSHGIEQRKELRTGMTGRHYHCAKDWSTRTEAHIMRFHVSIEYNP